MSRICKELAQYFRRRPYRQRSGAEQGGLVTLLVGGVSSTRSAPRSVRDRVFLPADGREMPVLGPVTRAVQSAKEPRAEVSNFDSVAAEVKIAYAANGDSVARFGGAPLLMNLSGRQ